MFIICHRCGSRVPAPTPIRITVSAITIYYDEPTRNGARIETVDGSTFSVTETADEIDTLIWRSIFAAVATPGRPRTHETADELRAQQEGTGA